MSRGRGFDGPFYGPEVTVPVATISEQPSKNIKSGLSLKVRDKVNKDD